MQLGERFEAKDCLHRLESPHPNRVQSTSFLALLAHQWSNSESRQSQQNQILDRHWHWSLVL